MSSKKKSSSKIATKGGVYALVITLIVLGIFIALNIFMEKVPSNITKYDISATKLYSVTSNTKALAYNLHQNVNIYWIVQAEKEDSIVQNLLNRYNDLSDHITVEKINPDVHPTFTANYTSEQVENNSIVVESGNRFRYIPYSDIYVTKVINSYYGTTETYFDGEGAITSAIDFVVTDDLPTLYVLQGHGEQEIDGDFAEAISKGNISTKPFSLLNVDEVPDEADAVLIYAPSSDISESELEMLREYVYGYGKVLVFSGPLESGAELKNLNALLSDYLVTVVPGIVVEADSDHYMATQYQAVPYYLMPNVVDNEITSSIVQSKYYVIMPISAGLQISAEADPDTVYPLLKTTGSSYSKTQGYKAQTYNKEEGDPEGPFTLAVDIKDVHGGEIVWFSSASMLSEGNYYSSGANMELVMNALSQLIGDREAIAIPQKSMSVGQLTITDSAKTTLKVLMLGVFPLTVFAAGVIVLLYRKRRQNEKV